MPKGFTLIEMLVSTAIFTVVMIIALGALLAMSESDRKAQTLKSVINNLNFSVDSMTRAIRTGYDYHCGSPTGVDCPAGSAYFAFTDSDGNKVAYCRNAVSGTLMREVVAGSGTLDALCTATGFSAVTAPEVNITNLAFYLEGSQSGVGNDTCNNGPCTLQPKVAILLSGKVQVTATQSTTFNLQTSVTQRLYDQ